MLVDQTVQFGDVRARVLLIELDRGRTVIHLRAEDPTDVSALPRRSSAAVDGQGNPLPHLVSLSGGTGLETHVIHVYDSVPQRSLVLLDPSGDAAISIDLEP